MSSRKSSLQANRTFDLQQFNYQNFELHRPRKNSSGRNVLQQYPLNIKDISTTIVLDEKLTAKLVAVKKLQKMEKQAIKLFYSNKIQDCFVLLQKCLSLSLQNNHSQHLLYVRYLQSQFSYKLKKFAQSRQFFNLSMKIIQKLTKQQKQKTRQYVASLQALNSCLLLEEGKYNECIQSIRQIQSEILDGRIRLSEKAVRSIQICRIQALSHLNEHQMVIQECQRWITKYSKMSVSLKQKYRVFSAGAESNKKIGRQQAAQETIIQLIQLIKKQRDEIMMSGQSEQNHDQKIKQLNSSLSKSYNRYVDIIGQQKIKAIFICRQWQQECPQSDHAISRLIKLYFQIGDYEEVLQQFQQLSQDYRKTSEDWQYLAEIKQYFGQYQQAEIFLKRALQSTKSQESQLRLEIKLLHYCDDRDRKQQMKRLQKKIKENKNKCWFEQIWQKYTQYLQQIGQDERLEKINSKLNPRLNQNNQQQKSNYKLDKSQLTQTGKFGNFNIQKNEVQNKILQEIRIIKQNIPLKLKQSQRVSK